MIAGVPGAGISAYFYLIAVLAMPFVAAYRAVRAGSLRAGRWPLVGRQLAIALGITAGLALGGIALGMLAAGPSATVEQATQAAPQVGAALARFGLALGLATLALVMASVHVAALLSSLRRRREMRRGGGPGSVEAELD